MTEYLLMVVACCLLACTPVQTRLLEPRASSSTQVSATDPPRVSPVDQYVTTRVRELRIPGLALAVLKNGRVVKLGAYGLANLETNAPTTPATEFRIASLSKQFIATAVMLLVQEGKLGLDDRATKYLDDAPATWDEITIRQLLTHTSGLVRDPIDYHPYTEQPITDVITAAYALPLNSAPGGRWLYSNIGYYVLAQVITKVSGTPWDAFIAERLFVPAHMTATRTGNAKEVIINRASGYSEVNHATVNAENWIAVRPSGAFISSALDLAQWDAFMDSHNPLSPANRRLMRTPALLIDSARVDYGFGWYVDSFLGRARIHHDGQYPGFRADYERFEDDSLTVIVLANSDRSDLAALALKVAGFYASTLTMPPFTLSAAVAGHAVADSQPIAIRITATDDGKAAPNSLVEMEIWDASGNTVYKEHKADESFDAGQTKVFTFSWTPTKGGTYSVNVGAYGQKWTPSYAWKEHAATITVH